MSVLANKKGSSKVCGWFSSIWPSWVWESQHASTENSWFLGHSRRSSSHRMAFFQSLKQNFVAERSSKVQIAFLKFTSSYNQVLVGCIIIPAVAEAEIINTGQSSHNPLQTPWLPWISYATQKLMLVSYKMVEKHAEAFHTFQWHFSKFKTEFYCISFF